MATRDDQVLSRMSLSFSAEKYANLSSCIQIYRMSGMGELSLGTLCAASCVPPTSETGQPVERRSVLRSKWRLIVMAVK